MSLLGFNAVFAQTPLCTSLTSGANTISLDCDDVQLITSGQLTINTGGVTVSAHNNESGAIEGWDNSGSLVTVGGILNNGIISSDGRSAANAISLYNVTITNRIENYGLITSGVAGNAGIDIQGDLATSIGGITNNAGAAISGGSRGIVIGSNVTLGDIINDGLIQTTNSINGYAGGILNFGRINTINNNSLGEISGFEAGIFNYGSIGSIVNSGLITSIYYGIYNDLLDIESLVNSNGVISGVRAGIKNNGTITNLENRSGSRIGGGEIGIDNSGLIDSLKNYGTIEGNGLTGVLNSGNKINTLVNRGQITGYNGLTNYGLIGISGAFNSGILNYGIIQGLSAGIENGLDSEGAIIVNIANKVGGLISGGNAGILNFSLIEALTNNGLILGTGGMGETGVSNESGRIISLLNNASGRIIGSYRGIYNNGEINNLTNYGVVSTTGSDGILNAGTIRELVNAGTLSGAAAIHNGGSITAITNTGDITGTSIGISNNGSIGTLNNAQGGNASTPATTGLTYSGALPTNYNIIINSPTSFGKLSVASGSGLAPTTPTLFGIFSGSAVANGIYADVLQGLFGSLDASGGFITGADFLISGASGAYGGFTYSLVADTATSCFGCWDLVFSGSSATSSDIITNSGNALSAVGTTLNPVFDGGTLTTSNGDSSNANFTVNALGGTITSPLAGGSATLSGVFSGVGAMTFNGSGIIHMNGVSTYTGGTTVASGTLSVGSSEASNTARLAGDVTVQAAGTLAGHGGIGGSVINGGVVAPGGSIGTLTIGGNYSQNSNATLLTAITPSQNSMLAVTGAAKIEGGFQIDADNGVYSKRTYTILTSSGLTGRFSGISGNLTNVTSLNFVLSYDAFNVYLMLVAGTADTQQSLVNTSQALQNTYTLQNSVLANSFSYDCTEFGPNGICVSAGGRNTAVSAANGLNNTSGLLIAAYRPHQQYRVGAYVDQNLSVNNAGSTVNLGNNTPLIGLFGAWNERLDGTGTEVKVSAAYGQKNTTVTRQVVGTSDPGLGSSQLNSQGAQVVSKYGFAVAPQVIVSPYAGIRYTQNNMGGYTEGASATVTAPLTYSGLNTNATTALAGVGASYRFTPKATLFGSTGVETDTNTANGTYSATGVNGLMPISFNTSPVKTRPTATLGATYDVEKNQRVGITGIYRQEPYQGVSTTTVMATYMVGL